jgi:hypothetical protein
MRKSPEKQNSRTRQTGEIVPNPMAFTIGRGLYGFILPAYYNEPLGT